MGISTQLKMLSALEYCGVPPSDSNKHVFGAQKAVDFGRRITF